MSDDQRVEAAAEALGEDRTIHTALTDRLDRNRAKYALAAADAVDREAGIHRVRVDDEAERKVRVLMLQLGGKISACWDHQPGAKFDQERAEKACADTARAVLAALTGAES